METLEFGTEARVSCEELFAFISDPRNWGTFAGNVESVRVSSDWPAEAATGHVTFKLLGMTQNMALEVLSVDRPRSFVYTMQQPGRPVVRHERVVEPTSTGARLRATSQTEPRSGLAGLYDRVLWLGFARMMPSTMRRLAAELNNHPGTPING